MNANGKRSKLGETIGRRRTALNLSRESLAKAVGVQSYILRDAELKETLPKNLCDILPKLAVALQCTVEDLLGIQHPQDELIKVAENLHELSCKILRLLKNGEGKYLPHQAD